MSEKEKMKKPSEGHRERLRKRFERSGFQGFHDYEVLELLLFYVIPRKDTKLIAKEMLKKFKHFHGVLNADPAELQMVKGISEKSAQFFKILAATISYYFEQKAENNEIQFTRLDELVDYIRATIGGMKNEVVRVLYLNSQNKLIGAENLSEGTVSEAVAFPRKVVEGALKHHATSVIIAHNHPGGVPEPSENDDAITRQIRDALKTVNISLQEHLIIAGQGYYSYRKNGFLE